jgi:mRNA interferase RelE/StbE
MYKLELSREAQRFYERAEKSVAKKLARCFQSLETDPKAGNNVKALQGPLAGAFRYRVGDLLVVYAINDSSVTVSVITIAGSPWNGCGWAAELLASQHLIESMNGSSCRCNLQPRRIPPASTAHNA